MGFSEEQVSINFWTVYFIVLLFQSLEVFIVLLCNDDYATPHNVCQWLLLWTET